MQAHVAAKCTVANRRGRSEYHASSSFVTSSHVGLAQFDKLNEGEVERVNVALVERSDRRRGSRRRGGGGRGGGGHAGVSKRAGGGLPYPLVCFLFTG